MLFQNDKTNETKNQPALASRRNPVTCQVTSTAAQDPRSQDRASYLKFFAEYTAALNPEGIVELELSQRLARDTWRINRALAIEENTFALADSELLTQVSVYRKRLTWNFRANRKLLLQLQSLRPAGPRKDKAMTASGHAA